MIYLLYSLEAFLINQEIEKIIKEHNIDHLNINHYDLDDDLINNVIDDALMIPLFGDKKLIIVNNAYLFTDTTKKGVMDQDPNIIDEYLSHSNPDTILVFTINTDKISERRKITKHLKEVGHIIGLTNHNLNTIIKNLFADYKISNSDITLLIKRVGEDLNILAQEIEKLKLYKINTKEISTEDIINLTEQTIDLDIFKFIDNIVNHHTEDAIITYQELLKLNEEPIKIIAMLGNQFRLMYQVKILAMEGYSESNIAEMLKIHPYRIKLALQNTNHFSTKILLEYLEKLGDLDLKIKNGSIDKDLALELFILNNH